MTKVCFKCHTAKPLDDFYKHPMMADGHLNKCKECTKRDVHQRSVEHPDVLAEYECRRRQQPARRAKQSEYAVKARLTKSDAYHAHYLLGNALRDGRVVRQPCERCGGTPAEAHHDDYTKPLEVRWLCFQCHNAEHGRHSNVTHRFKTEK